MQNVEQPEGSGTASRARPAASRVPYFSPYSAKQGHECAPATQIAKNSARLNTNRSLEPARRALVDAGEPRTRGISSRTVENLIENHPVGLRRKVEGLGDEASELTGIGGWLRGNTRACTKSEIRKSARAEGAWIMIQKSLKPIKTESQGEATTSIPVGFTYR